MENYSFPSFSTQSAQSGQPGHSGQTLPPLSGTGLSSSTNYGHASAQSMNSLPSHTPNSSVSSVSGFAYHQNPGQTTHARGLQLPIPQPPLRPVEPSSTATFTTNYSTAITPSYMTSAPPNANAAYSNNLISIQPRPQEVYSQTQAYPSLSHQVPTQSSSLYLPPMDTQPTHVVGQQGRRGVLPSVSGKEAPMTSKGVIPQKASDGKFHCEYCTRTYQHAKHLKRHHLRHTGERPYMCNLCSDTFSRSDILKRHYQKCAQRRGVPEGTDHLEGSRSHLSRKQRSRPSSRGNSGSVSDVSGYTFSEIPSNTSTSYLSSNGLPGLMYPPQHHHTESASSTSTEPMLRNDSHHDVKPYRPRSMPPMEGMPLNGNNFGNSQTFAVPPTSGAELGNGMSAYSVAHTSSNDQIPSGMGYSSHTMDSPGLHANLQNNGAGSAYSYSITNNLQAISIQ